MERWDRYRDPSPKMAISVVPPTLIVFSLTLKADGPQGRKGEREDEDMCHARRRR